MNTGAAEADSWLEGDSDESDYGNGRFFKPPSSSSLWMPMDQNNSMRSSLWKILMKKHGWLR